MTNATAVAEITDMALNATNPEVKEAFELMMKGGTPSSTDFSYGVPRFNTELWGLYQLAEDNQFQRDDTTALAIAMVDGLFRTMGDDNVRIQVRADDNAMLSLARETTEWQTSRGYYLLRNLPLEAKICWAWRGNTSPLRGPYILQGQFQRTQLTLNAYEWNTVDPRTLKDMRSDAESRGWTSKDINHFVATLEDYFWFSGQQQHWYYQTYPEIIENVDGVNVTYGAVLNVEFQYYERFRNGLKGLGDCQAETVFMDAWLKSVGESSVITWKTTGNSPKPKDWLSHNHIIYFDLAVKKWTISRYQLTIYWGGKAVDSDLFDFWIYKPPVNQVHYMSESDFSLLRKGNGYYLFSKIPLGEIYRMLRDGIPASDLKQWLLYS